MLQLKNLTDQGKQLATSIFADAMNKLKSLADTYHAAIGSVKVCLHLLAYITVTICAPQNFRFAENFVFSMVQLYIVHRRLVDDDQVSWHQF